MDTSIYDKIVRNWRIESPIICNDTSLSSLPKSIASRTVLADTRGNYWILESIEEEAYEHKITIAETLEQLEIRGCYAINAYQRNSLGQFITSYEGQLCMLLPYVENIPMSRENWLFEEWRAEAMADFLINLRRISNEVSFPDHGTAFSFINLVKEKTEAFDRHRPEVSASLARVYQELEQSLFSLSNTLPTAFCHGNFHPMNVIWGEKSIRSLVDWEHCGIKPEAYDAAQMVGEIGFTSPGALSTDFTKLFIRKLREATLFSEETWSVFFELIIASRYICLSEWMRTHNEKNRDLETLYMNLLITQKNYLRKAWELA